MSLKAETKHIITHENLAFDGETLELTGTLYASGDVVGRTLVGSNISCGGEVSTDYVVLVGPPVSRGMGTVALGNKSTNNVENIPAAASMPDQPYKYLTINFYGEELAIPMFKALP